MSAGFQRTIIARAIALLDDEGTWCRHTIARTRNGRPCLPWAATSARYCAFGALLRASFEICGDRAQAQVLASNCEAHITAVLGLNHRLSRINDRGDRAMITKILREALSLT